MLFVGRFERRKGIDVLLAAIPEVAAAFPNARFVLAGAPGQGDLWAAFACAHPDLAGGRVAAPGRVSETQLEELYRQCDVFVAPSRYESFGLIYLEAMRHAKPVVACDAGGIPEVVTDGVTGLLAPPATRPVSPRAFGACWATPVSARDLEPPAARTFCDVSAPIGWRRRAPPSIAG